MSANSTLPMTVVLVGVTIAAGTDAWKFRVYNVVTVPLLVTGLLYHGLTAGVSGVVESLLGILIATGPLAWPYSRGGMGAGDLKLMAGIGAWLGPWVALHVVITSGLAAGVYAAALLVWQMRAGASGVGRSKSEFCGRHSPPTAVSDDTLSVMLEQKDRRRWLIPYGVLIALGVVLTAWWMRNSPS
ncbi:MAG: prepilin peptidase [Planctomycetes bacterium]|nr:prepilin peptidase [Planctomycetota bacterium]